MQVSKILDEITHSHPKKVNANFVVTSIALKMVQNVLFGLHLLGLQKMCLKWPKYEILDNQVPEAFR